MIERVYYRIKLNNDQIIYSQHVNITQTTGDSVNDTMSQKAITDELNKKFDKIGGIISGDVTVQGDLYVTGDNHTVDTETLRVKDATIVINSDGVPLVEKAGLVISTDSKTSYGIVYDPVKEAVVLGKGYFDADGKFLFNPGEGEPVATRADSSLIADGHIIKWDAIKRKLVDSGISIDDIGVDPITALNLSAGDITVIYDTIDGIQVMSQGQITRKGGAVENVEVNYDIPIIAGKGVSIDRDEASDKIIIKVASECVSITAPAEATQGTLTQEQLDKLQESDANYIMFNNEMYYLGDKGHIEGYLGYTHNGYDNNRGWQKTITITLSTRAWVLNTAELGVEVVQETGASSTKVMSQKAVTDAIASAITTTLNTEV